MSRHLTSESVSEGHPDKVCDLIADAILDHCLNLDPDCRVACEVLAKSSRVVVAGEIGLQRTRLQTETIGFIVRNIIQQIGYTDPSEDFNSEKVFIENLIGVQSENIASAVNQKGELGAGDQGIIFGFATDETPELLPLPLVLAHRLAETISKARKDGTLPWALPDGKTQVTVEYDDEGRPQKVAALVISWQHRKGVPAETITQSLVREILPKALREWHRGFVPRFDLFINPGGDFVIGGPTGDCGVTGRKIIVDTYGGFAHHGGGAFSGKDPTKVDRSAAYFARYAARQVVLQKIAKKAEVHVSYAIGRSWPISLDVTTFGTGDEIAARKFLKTLDFRPQAIIENLRLRRPIYQTTTNYGHFGKSNLPWEQPKS